MAYEASTAERARGAWDHLVSTLKGYYGCRLCFWKFDVFQTPEIRNIAATDAASASMVLIATRGAGELPLEVQAWIDVWLPQKCEARDSQSALTVLFDTPQHNLGASVLPQFAYLQRVARRGHMDFFVSTFDQPGETDGLSWLQFTERPRTRPDSNTVARAKSVSILSQLRMR